MESESSDEELDENEDSETRKRRNHGLKWTDEDLQRLRDLTARGMSDDDIGKTLYRTACAVNDKRRNIPRHKFRVSSFL